MKDKELISVIVPVFNEAEVIGTFYKRLKSVVESLAPLSYEIVFVDDGSKDDSHQRLIDLANSDLNVKIIKFSRNFGHQVAITAGIEIAKGDVVVVIDADLQDPPEVIVDFLKKWREGYDVVYAVREKREGEGKLKLYTAAMFYRLLKSITKIDVPVDTGDFRLMSRKVVDHFKELKETDRFVRGLVSWIGFKQVGVFYKRDKRYAGHTKYPYRKMFKFALDGITSFSSVPLKLATWLGYFTSFLAFLYLSTVFFQKIMGITVQGFATIMVGMLFLGGVQLICLGIIGEYIGRIFSETKKRPMYVIEDIYQSKGDG
ncbi:MAG: glycosyltransferase [Nitrospira bacterium SG8_35_4]|nr:MAG: glycosyltransferase [Nitrospira bacterium SG8_35_4]